MLGYADTTAGTRARRSVRARHAMVVWMEGVTAADNVDVEQYRSARRGGCRTPSSSLC